MTRFASAVVVDARGWILLQERDEHPAIDPEKWGFCGGHLEPGEDYGAGALRELEEETGLRLAADDLEPAGDFTVFHEHSQTLDTFRLYAAGLDLSDDDIECHEGRRIVFVDPAAASRLDLTAAARIALPAFLGSELYARLSSHPGSRSRPTTCPTTPLGRGPATKPPSRPPACRVDPYGTARVDRVAA